MKYYKTNDYDPATGEVRINGQWVDENDWSAREEAEERAEAMEQFRAGIRNRRLPWGKK